MVPSVYLPIRKPVVGSPAELSPILNSHLFRYPSVIGEGRIGSKGQNNGFFSSPGASTVWNGKLIVFPYSRFHALVVCCMSCTTSFLFNWSCSGYGLRHRGATISFRVAST